MSLTRSPCSPPAISHSHWKYCRWGERARVELSADILPCRPFHISHIHKCIKNCNIKQIPIGQTLERIYRMKRVSLDIHLVVNDPAPVSTWLACRTVVINYFFSVNVIDELEQKPDKKSLMTTELTASFSSLRLGLIFFLAIHI